MSKFEIKFGVKTPVGRPIVGKSHYDDEEDIDDTPEYRQSLKQTLIDLGYTSFNKKLPTRNKPYRRRGTPRKAMENTLQQYFTIKGELKELPSKVENIFTGCVNSCPDKLSPAFCFNLLKVLPVITAAAVQDYTSFSDSWSKAIAQVLQLVIQMITHCHNNGQIQVLFNDDYETESDKGIFDIDDELAEALDLHIEGNSNDKE